MSLPALSIRQPWAWALCAGHEDASRNAPGTRATAGRSPSAPAPPGPPAPADLAWIRDTLGVEVPDHLTRGALVGVSRLLDVIDDSTSPWAQPGQLHWLLADGQLWPGPVPCRGRLRFFQSPQMP